MTFSLVRFLATTIVVVLALPECPAHIKQQLDANDGSPDSIACDEVVYQDPDDQAIICATPPCQREMQSAYDIVPSDCQITIPLFDITITKAGLKSEAKELCGWDLDD